MYVNIYTWTYYLDATVGKYRKKKHEYNIKYEITFYLKIMMLC